MDFRMDTYIGNEHYWIRFKNGTHEVRHETPDDCPDNETVFTGHYEQCVEWIKKAVNAEEEETEVKEEIDEDNMITEMAKAVAKGIVAAIKDSLGM